MPAKRGRPRKSAPTTNAPDPEPAPGPAANANPFEESLALWTRFARQTGESVTEYLRRFGEEQQKGYETWASSVRDAARPTTRPPEVDEVRARYEEWNRRATEVGSRVRETFEAMLGPQKELLELWTKPLLPKGATDEDRTREALTLVQKLWTGLSTDISRQLFTALQPSASVDDLVRLQEASIKEFTDSFQKLTQIYFTSPAFVTLFGKNLDNSLDRQSAWNAQEDLVSKMTGLPSRREITELREAVRDLSQKVDRFGPGRA